PCPAAASPAPFWARVVTPAHRAPHAAPHLGPALPGGAPRRPGGAGPAAGPQRPQHHRRLHAADGGGPGGPGGAPAAERLRVGTPLDSGVTLVWEGPAADPVGPSPPAAYPPLCPGFAGWEIGRDQQDGTRKCRRRGVACRSANGRSSLLRDRRYG